MHKLRDDLEAEKKDRVEVIASLKKDFDAEISLLKEQNDAWKKGMEQMMKA